MREEDAPERLFGMVCRSRYRSTHTLKRGLDNRIVGDAARGESGRECPVTIEPENSTEHDLLDEPRQDEIDLRAENPEAVPAGGSRARVRPILGRFWPLIRVWRVFQG